MPESKRFATAKGGTIVGMVNWNGEKDHPYGDTVEFVGPLPDEIGVEWVGKSAKSLQEELDKWNSINRYEGDKPTAGERLIASAKEALRAVTPELTPRAPDGSEDTPGAPPHLTAAQLLAYDKAGDIKYFTFVKEAKRILGKDYPESEEKPAIVKALEKKANA